MTPAGSINAWTCGDCGKSMIAICFVEGVTPMFLACRETEGCKGRAVSAGFPLSLQVINKDLIKYEWFKPSLRAAKRMGPEMLAHVKAGGLVLRLKAD